MENILQYDYTYKFKEKPEIHFSIRLDAKTLRLIQSGEPQHSDWARLENKQCQNCTLKKEEHNYCPVALNMVEILPKFRDVYSYEQVEVFVKNSQRNYSATTSVQHALGSMLGIYMVSSGCPILNQLKPMVRFHLPFASLEETMFRSVTTYLLGQYFNYLNGERADFEMEDLVKIYKEIQQVNYDMADRLRTISAKDANINALIVLDVFAKELPQNIMESMKSLQYLFE